MKNDEKRRKSKRCLRGRRGRGESGKSKPFWFMCVCYCLVFNFGKLCAASEHGMAHQVGSVRLERLKHYLVKEGQCRTRRDAKDGRKRWMGLPLSSHSSVHAQAQLGSLGLNDVVSPPTYAFCFLKLDKIPILLFDKNFGR